MDSRFRGNDESESDFGGDDESESDFGGDDESESDFGRDDESESAFAGMTSFPGVYASSYRLTTFPVRADS